MKRRNFLHASILTTFAALGFGKKNTAGALHESFDLSDTEQVLNMPIPTNVTEPISFGVKKICTDMSKKIDVSYTFEVPMVWYTYIGLGWHGIKEEITWDEHNKSIYGLPESFEFRFCKLKVDCEWNMYSGGSRKELILTDYEKHIHRVRLYGTISIKDHMDFLIARHGSLYKTNVSEKTHPYLTQLHNVTAKESNMYISLHSFECDKIFATF